MYSIKINFTSGKELNLNSHQVDEDVIRSFVAWFENEKGYQVNRIVFVASTAIFTYVLNRQNITHIEITESRQ